MVKGLVLDVFLAVADVDTTPQLGLAELARCGGEPLAPYIINVGPENSAYIKRRLKEKISNSDIVLGIAGMYASHSDWMEWELDTALEEKVPIVGVIPWGQERISKVVTDRSVEDVHWNTESIVEAIRKWAK